MSKIAIVAGASGVVGNELLLQLLEENYFSKIKVLVRKPIKINHSKLEQVIVDFENLQNYNQSIIGDVVFCCLGTTIKTAGSKEAFIKVDYTYALHVASIAKGNGVQQFVLVSSLGANKKSSNFYLKVKGDIESALENLLFKNLIIVRPSMLLGARKEFRLGELIGKRLMKLVGVFFVGKLKKYKAIQAKKVAKSMIELSKENETGVRIVESDIIQELGK